MRVGLVVLPIALVLLAPSLGIAQPLQSFQDLALRVNLDDRLRIEDQSGMRTTGRLTRLTPEEVTIQTDAGEKRFTSATVREIAYAAIRGARASLSGPALVPHLARSRAAGVQTARSVRTARSSLVASARALDWL